MRAILSALWLFLFSACIMAQESVPALGNTSDKGQRVFDQRNSAGAGPARTGQAAEAMSEVEEMPRFIDGDEALFKYLGDQIRYPRQAIEEKREGVVLVTFVVERDGKITGARVRSGIGGGCEKEALRVVKGMPAWVPGKQGGKTVRVQYDLPIRFTLGSQDD